MKGGLKTGYNLGFTIVEVMIVLAVSSAIFLSAVNLVGGKQDVTQFNQSIQQVESQIQQTVDDVINGFYPSINNFICTPNAGANVTISGGNQTQGSNNGCIFLGKLIQFGISPSASSEGNQLFNTYSIVGALCASGEIPGSPNCNLDQSNTLSSNLNVNTYPTVLRSANGSVDATTISPLEYGLNVPSSLTNASMYYNGNTSDRTGSVGFLQSLASYSSGALVSGAQKVNLYTITGTNTNNEAEATFIIQANTAADWLAVNQVNICFNSATTQQSGLVTIGGQNSQLAVTLQVYNDLGCQ